MDSATRNGVRINPGALSQRWGMQSCMTMFSAAPFICYIRKGESSNNFDELNEFTESVPRLATSGIQQFTLAGFSSRRDPAVLLTALPRESQRKYHRCYCTPSVDGKMWVLTQGTAQLSTVHAGRFLRTSLSGEINGHPSYVLRPITKPASSRRTSAILVAVIRNVNMPLRGSYTFS